MLIHKTLTSLGKELGVNRDTVAKSKYQKLYYKHPVSVRKSLYISYEEMQLALNTHDINNITTTNNSPFRN